MPNPSEFVKVISPGGIEALVTYRSFVEVHEAKGFTLADAPAHPKPKPKKKDKADE